MIFRSGSKCEELNVSKTSPPCANERTSINRVTSSLTGHVRTWMAAATRVPAISQSLPSRPTCGRFAPSASSPYRKIMIREALMSALSRRHFLALTGSAAAAAMSEGARAAMGPTDRFDLVIRGGDVLDPSQSLKAKRDIGIRWGTIEAIETEIPPERALKTIDASGRLVLPGLVDLHCHVYPYGSAIGIPADELVQFEGTTTVVSAGDGGANNLAALRRYIVAQSRARIYAFVHIANNGLSAFPVAELYNIDNAQVEACAMALAENQDFLIGVKVRMSENIIFKHGVEPLKRGIQACEMCGWPAKMMVLIRSLVSTPPICPIILAGQPHISQAWMPRLSGSIPCLKMTFSDILTFTPIRKSGFSASAIAQVSTCALSML